MAEQCPGTEELKFKRLNVRTIVLLFSSDWDECHFHVNKLHHPPLSNMFICYLLLICHKTSLIELNLLIFVGRGLFIIDGRGILRQITMNDLPVGRSVDETLRLVQAFQYTDEHGEVCPAGWKPGQETVSTSIFI